jgi:hypothetical protein
MSGSRVRGWNRGVAAGCFLAAWYVLAAAGPAAADDLLDKAKKANDLAAQKLKADVRTALAEAARLERTDPGQAAVVLRRALNQIDDDTALGDRQRAELRQQVRSRLRDVEATARAKQAESDLGPKGAADKAVRDPRRTDDPRLKSAKGAVNTAKGFIEAGSGRLTGSGLTKNERDRRFASALDDVKNSSMPIEGFIEKAPKELAARIAKRKTGPELTPQEVKTLKGLNSVLSPVYRNARFRDVIDDLAERAQLTILLDKGSLDEAMVEYEAPVNFKAEKVSVRTALKAILADKGLTYVIKGGTIQVVTPERASRMMVTRAYYVGDLVANVDFRMHPLLARAQLLHNVQALIELIQTSFEPQSWQANNGGGSITFNEATRSIVIRNSAEMHYTLGGLLGR